jgi:hypothetical protein
MNARSTASRRMRDGDCAATPGCKTLGAWSAAAGRCGVHRDEDCRKADFCREEARCTAAEGACVIGSSRDCARGDACAESGWCTAQRDETTGLQRCVAGRNRDCRKSRACRDEARCKAVEGVCVAPASLQKDAETAVPTPGVED